MASYEDVCMWKKDRLVNFLRERGLKTTGKVDQLRALVYGAIQFDVPKKPSAAAENRQRAEQYQYLLTVDGEVLPDPLTVLNSGWVGEKSGMSLWPPCMYGDISTYLVDKSERDLRTRLLTDYKEGKAFSYFDSKWLKEVYYHAIYPDCKYCFLKSECTPSMNIHHGPHKVWVCIAKTSGQIASAYCSCFAGLGSTCNHVAAVLFKLDYAWQNGYTNKACTSVPAQWTAPPKTAAEPKRVTEMEWRKPHYTKKGTSTSINPSARQLFSPQGEKARKPCLEDLMGSLYISCSNACAFQYAAPSATKTYSVEDDVNVGIDVEVSTSPAVPMSLKTLVIKHHGDLNQLPGLSEIDVNILESATQYQSDNLTWHEQRIGRITGSMAHSVLTKARKIWASGDPGNMENLVGYILGRKTINPNLTPLKYGRETEPVARERYIQIMSQKGHTNLKVRICGMFVHPEKIYMGASPDGVVRCDCCGDGLLEIKCPLQIAHCSPEDNPPTYLIWEGNHLNLKKSHQYHTQVIMQLCVTKFNWCDFFVYTKRGYFLQRLHRQTSQGLIEELMAASKIIFTRYILPELYTTEPGQAVNPEPSTSSDDTQPSQQYSGGDPSEDQSLQDVQMTADAPGFSVVKTPPRKKRKKSVKGKKAGPVYLCSVCQEVCKDDIDSQVDNSVGCDRCFQWFHWGCVGFDGLDIDVWYCSSCLGGKD